VINAETKDKMSIKNKTLRLILGDQLNINHSWFTIVDVNVTYVLMEIRSETDYAKHHIQKVIGIFSAMQDFAKELQIQHHDVIYIHLNDENNHHRFDENVMVLIEKYKFTQFEFLLPDEYRVDEHLKAFTQKLKIPTKIYDTEHFYTSRSELGDLFADKNNYLMESFYRYMRKKHKVLVDDDNKPMLGKWNFDEDNRQKLPRLHKPINPLLFYTSNRLNHKNK
jgi:deoxyribodipyrimidine photolyase-related protein